MPQDSSKPLYTYGGFKVYANRVENAQGCLFMKKSQVIPIKKISSVEANAMTNGLTIITDDGRKHSFRVMNVQKARDAILEAM